MDRKFFVVADASWLTQSGSHKKRIGKQSLCPIANTAGHLASGCNILVKWRTGSGRLLSDDAARLEKYKEEFFVKSEKLCEFIATEGSVPGLIVFFFEGTPTDARCIVQVWPDGFLEDIEDSDPTLRLHSFGLPPADATLVDAASLVSRLYRESSESDAELFAVHTARFLSGPHILTPLFAHIMSLRSDDNAAFPIQLKKVAEQLRMLLLEHGKSVGIARVKRSHLDLWAEVQGSTVAFLDGGVARIPSLAGMEPMALRVGIYAVTPGEREPKEREHWSMTPFVVADILDGTRPVHGETDRRRLLEASRYVLEPLVALSHVRGRVDTCALFIHGPLANQFAQYDEGEPNYIPCLSPAFLEEYGIRRDDVTGNLQDLPHEPASGEPLWNQFMAVYGHVLLAVARHETPVVGVVERVTGRALTYAVLDALLDDRVIDEPYVKRIRQILERFEIADDFLFGCVLQEGEYVTPIRITKNLPRRARERWQPVVRQYPQPLATMLKADEVRFPFRVEFNEAGAAKSELLLRLLYHTARLLPRYAFPVGLDIADKYARVPDWIAKGVSVEVSAALLRRALRTGDPKLVAQVKQLLARTPRDFFYRPVSEI